MFYRRMPFAAIVGQDKLKSAYLANIVNPKIGGLLVNGPKGTGKSSIVRSVENILPEYESVEGCLFDCDPRHAESYCTLCRERQNIKTTKKTMRIVELPLSCTEDRLIGTIDIERLLTKGEKVVIPGILGQANRNILYVDEVNLLPDHLVDDILDAAALHWNSIEREGLSITHPADFVLVGTMNPEEGDLRPQILDRFPLCVKITSVKEPEARVEIVKRNLLFESDPADFFKQFQTSESEIKQLILKARTLLGSVAIDDAMIEAIARSCSELKVDGQRPDIIIMKTALTMAALGGRTRVVSQDIFLSAELALIHRTRDGGLLEPPLADEIARIFAKNCGHIDESSSAAEQKAAETSSMPGETAQDLKKKS